MTQCYNYDNLVSYPQIYCVTTDTEQYKEIKPELDPAHVGTIKTTKPNPEWGEKRIVISYSRISYIDARFENILVVTLNQLFFCLQKW